jgi:hypothetical protein
MTKIIDAGNSFPPNRAFVIQLQEPVDGQWLKGRVEHVFSGRARRFESVEDIVAFMKETCRRFEKESAQAERAARLTATAGKRRRPRQPAVIRFISSRLGVLDRLEGKVAKSA